MELKYSNGRFLFHPISSKSGSDDARALLKQRMKEILCEKAVERIAKRRMAEFDSYDRLDWDAFVFKNRKHKKFLRKIRMSRDSFNKLVEYVQDDLKVDEAMASIRYGAITPPVCVFVTLRFLAGGQYIDAYSEAHISIASFYRVVHKTMQAIINCPQLAIKFPQSKDECKERANGFVEMINQPDRDAIVNCVSVLDGLHIKIQTPPKSIGNVRAYWSGHKFGPGVNMQAACDEHCRFTYVALAAVGSANDRVAIQDTNFYGLIDRMSRGYVVIGDAAYEPTERLVPLYYGAKRKDPLYDNFNYFGSRLRQCIERAFGLMVKKWGILQKPLQVKFKNISKVVMAIVRLHNFCINERIERGLGPEPTPEAYNKLFHPTVPMKNDNADPTPTADEPDEYRIQGYSVIRHNMVLRIQRKGYKRPVKPAPVQELPIPV